MPHQLVCHPDTPQTAIESVRAAVERGPGGHLSLGFRLIGKMDEILWPGDAASGHGPWKRADALWKHSCFEAFGAVPAKPEYFEVNLATSGRWAAYVFQNYRAGMHSAEDAAIIAAHWKVGPRKAEMHAVLEVPAAYRELDWRLALSAVIEAKDGSKSYWALAHPPGKPDFHHRDCFALDLATGEAA